MRRRLSIQIQKDPRVAALQSDLEKQHEFAMRILDRVNAGHDAVNQIRSVRGQLDALKKRLGADGQHKAGARVRGRAEKEDGSRTISDGR